ncbi:MAG: HAMP domain-containing protein [Rhodopseudomonas sp.]|uniref:methyl-accepting chemotaxis protein n=1 Tax=Rhodopseudomonas sp. TaxID=1078 RepID=UPI0017F38EAA|nr:methyl-accepting chemotaxis protein [Rhodopseudomonas sp.]NVN86799.1 HAMP domain-containing protein [Rhodopseudomonas sp.]
MLNIKSISVRIMVAISLVGAISCAALAGFGIWRQQVAVDLALERELRADYANMLAALEGETRKALVVSNALATMPQLKDLVRAGDRNGVVKLLKDALRDIEPLGLELITIQTPPGIAFARVHKPEAFGDDVAARRKTVVQAFQTKKQVGGIEAGRDALNVFGTTPIMDGATLLGTIDIGAPFGETFVKTTKARFGIDVAIHQLTDGAVKTLATTLSGAAPTKALLERALGETIIQTGDAEGRPIASTYGPIKNFSGQPVAVVEIVRDTSGYQALARQSMMWFAAVTAFAMLIAALIAAWLGRGLGQPIRKLEEAMGQISAGTLNVVVPGAQRSDEIGSMARAVGVFKDGLAETGQLRAAQEQQRIDAEGDRRKTLQALATRFEDGVGSVVAAVGTAAVELRTTAQSMAATAEESVGQTTAVAAASEVATQNAQAVAAAIEQLNASVNEIAQRVNESAKVSGSALDQANNTNAQVNGLAEAAQRIGDVVKLISEIAAQTNLLALNATIEAARAGESGRGFAVVASEVKALATQTSKATDEISAQVTAIQNATKVSVEAIGGITSTIGRVSEIASAIASAVEEQSAATREIAQNVSEAARSTGEVSQNIVGVTEAAHQTGEAAARVVDSSAELSRNGETLRTQVEAFLREVRAA